MIPENFIIPIPQSEKSIKLATMNRTKFSMIISLAAAALQLHKAAPNRKWKYSRVLKDMSISSAISKTKMVRA